MNTDLDFLTPVPNNWFSTSIEYRGYGKAEFQNPTGTVEGPTIIRFDERGECDVEMELANFSTEKPMAFGLLQFLSGTDPIEDEGSISLPFGVLDNHCNKLTISTDEGTFLAAGEILYGFTETTIRFYPLDSQFHYNTNKREKYWILPLSNLISSFSQRDDTLNQHPLRIYPTPVVPEDFPESEKLYAMLYANQKNNLIIFHIDQELGFIEALSDFDTRKEQLLNGIVRNTITAVMVGEVGQNQVLLENIEESLPVNFLPLLGVATGNEIGSPWIELRDADGNLVRRIHKSLGHPVFSKGHAAIREEIHRGIGHLLSTSYVSTAFKQSFLRVSLRNIIRAGTYNHTLEDRLRQIFVALDNLCKEYEVSFKEKISTERQRRVDVIVREASATVQQLAVQASEQKEEQDARILQRIAQNLTQAKVVTSNFGIDVVTLINKFDLPDATIMEEYHKNNPRTNNKRWVAIIPTYRGIVMHRGYFDFQQDHEIDHVIQTLNHLHDILLRIIFKILNYKGNYHPPVISLTASETIDWVKLDTPARRLGYSGKNQSDQESD